MATLAAAHLRDFLPLGVARPPLALYSGAAKTLKMLWPLIFSGKVGHLRRWDRRDHSNATA